MKNRRSITVAGFFAAYFLLLWLLVAVESAAPEEAGASITTRGLVKYTKAEVENIIKAGNVRGFDESLVYLMNGDKGAPMHTCKLHTAASIVPTTPPAPVLPEAGAGEAAPETP